MRCPDCMKFVSMETQEPEWLEEEGDADVVNDGERAWTELEARLVRACADCGTELKEATFNMDVGLVDPALLEHPDDGEGETHRIVWSLVSSGMTERVEGRGRSCKSFYGVEADVQFRCEPCQADIGGPVHVSDEVQASGMDEMV